MTPPPRNVRRADVAVQVLLGMMVALSAILIPSAFAADNFLYGAVALLTGLGSIGLAIAYSLVRRRLGWGIMFWGRKPKDTPDAA